MTTIAVIDHGAGNLVSMEQALLRAGATPTRITSATDLTAFDGVVLPGVGATGAAMRTMTRRGLAACVTDYDGPLLGVCVGMQLLFEHSAEDDNACLGMIAGSVRRLDASPLPHMGWNDVQHDGEPLLGSSATDTFYFVHSFVPQTADVSVTTGWTTYGDDRFASVVRHGNIAGVQFHPERSGPAGAEVLRRFVDACSEVDRAA